MNQTRTFKSTSHTNRHLRRLSRAVSLRRNEFSQLSDGDLRKAYQSLRLQHQDSSDSFCFADQTLISSTAFAVESLHRRTGMLAYNVQIEAGLAMARGTIAEMQTGEGKTLTSMFPITAFALAGQGVHVATVNQYLASRDCEFLQPALELLGISVGISNSGASTEEKRNAYMADVTFATGYEFGFDFLRDQISSREESSNQLGVRLLQRLFGDDDAGSRSVQRGFPAGIVDEVDSVFIDEASTPLVLSSGSLGRAVDESIYFAAKSAADKLEIDVDFQLDETANTICFTEAGDDTVHATGCLSAIQSRNMLRPWRQYVQSALRATHLMHRDVNYIVSNDTIEIVDEFTGRIFSDRNWRDGLHQAVEAKEGVTITEERRTIAKISRQRYFQRYQMLCGMTGTADGHQRELQSCYRTPVVIIPRRKKLLRQQLATRYFPCQQSKSAAIVLDAIARTAGGQPVLICTRTIYQSEMLAELLRCDPALGETTVKVLNGVQDEDEATLVAEAGTGGVITVATNMAGRGTDIKPDAVALEAGGLHVIGFEHSESRRIDRQLLGRCGRQGDPGSFQFFASAEDHLIHRRDQRLSKQIARIATLDGVNSKAFDRRILRLQNLAEADAYQVRQSVMREELWLDKIKKVAG